jgi:DNA-binding transcriptional MerR regulator
MTETPIPFKDMCTRFDVTPRTLRYYEYIELLAPLKQGRSRFYGPRECARLTLILRGRHFGFSLEEIRQWLLIYDMKGTRSQLEAFVEMADRRLAALAEEEADLARRIADLRVLRAASAGELSQLP